MLSFTKQLRVLLIAAGLDNVFTNGMPDKPDRAIMIKETTGPADLETHDGSVYERPRAQVLVRANDFETAWSDAKTAKKALRRQNEFIAGTWYLKISPESLQDLGKERTTEPARHEVSFNLQAIKEEGE